MNVERLLIAKPHLFTARRGEKTVFAGGRAMAVHTSGERVLHLPNGQSIRVAVDDSGVATQIEETDRLHAIARPKPIRLKLITGE